MAEIFIVAFGLVLIIEGLGPLLFPNRWSEYVQKMVNEGPRTLRQIGLVLVVCGLLVIFIFGR